MVEFLELLMPKPRRRLPVTRGECAEGSRPCPMVSCRHHLLIDVSANNQWSQARDFDEDDPDSIAEALESMDETCSLDVADQGGLSQAEVADLLNVSAVRVEQHETIAIMRVRSALPQSREEQSESRTYRRRLKW